LVLEGHGSDISTVDWHPYYSLIASGGKDRYIKIWDPRQRGEICSMYNHTNSVCKARFDPNGDYLLSGGRDQMVKVFEIRTMKELLNFKMHDSEILCKSVMINFLALDWNPAKPGIFASADHSGRVNICSISCKKPLSILSHAQDAQVWDISWNNMGTQLATCGGDKLVNLFTSKNWIPNQTNFNLE